MAKNYKSAGSGYTVKCSEDEIVNTLVELYTYRFKEARDIDATIDDDMDISEIDPEKAFELGMAQGAVDALSNVLLAVLGGGQMFDIWQSTISWLDKTNNEIGV